ncbi:beta strand repeat-containing protein, partial [Flavobacterium rhizosphaerae]
MKMYLYSMFWYPKLFSKRMVQLLIPLLLFIGVDMYSQAPADENFGNALIGPFANTISIGGWTFTGTGGSHAIANSTQAITPLNTDEGANDYSLFMNVYGQGVVEYFMSSTSGNEFALQSFDVSANPGGSTSFTIEGLKDGSTVTPVVTINLGSSSSSGGATYTYTNTAASLGPYGVLSFGSEYQNIDQVKFVFSGVNQFYLDNIDAEPAITGPSCTMTASITSQTNIACNGGATGSLTVAPTGGASPYSYLWNDSAAQATATATGLSAGAYSVTITDANGCTATATATITQPSAALNLTPASQTNIACNGGSTGAATVNAATGGTGPYTYNWTPGNPAGDGTTSVTGLSAGTWTVTVTDANGCTASQNFTITQPPALNLTPASQTNIACNGGSTGAATVNAATGGTGSYTYNWTPGNPAGDGTTSVTGLSAGTWTVTVTDANGCTASQNFTITQPAAALNLTPASQTNIACNGGSTGAATVNAATGGTGPYTYNWTPGNPAGDGTTSVTGLSAGTWTVTVTDANGCTASQNFTITQPPALNLTPASQTNIACNGGSTGAATVNAATGGTGPYTYNWTPGNPTGDGTTSVTGLSAGTWTVTVTDANGCTASQNFTITQPATALVASAVVDANVSCNGGSNGSATVTATGGTSPYTYEWNNNATTASITGVAAGTYTVTVTDANGCTATASVTITEPAILTASAVVDSNVSCNGGTTGAATINLTGGTAPFEYAIYNATYVGVPDSSLAVSGLPAGTYPVTVTDANGCTATTSVTIVEPIALTASAVVDANVSCNGGTTGAATINLTGGTAPFEYVIYNGTYVGVPDSSLAVSGLPAGTYPVTVTDANGCTATTSVTISEPTMLTASAVVDANISCNGGSNGSATVTATGGTSPYSYEWSNNATTPSITGVAAGTYTVTITDVNGCTATASVTITEPAMLTASAVVDANVSCNGGTTGSATINLTGGTAPFEYVIYNATYVDVPDSSLAVSGLPAGTYPVTVTDANGCTATTSVTIVEPITLTASAVVDANVSCNGGTTGAATINLTGGTAPFEYAIYNATYVGVPDSSLGVTGLPAGTYPVTITDANGCTATTSVTITEPAMLTASAVVDANISCNGGTNGAATINLTGGTAPFEYIIDNTTYSNITDSSLTVSGLAAGTYPVAITDGNGCTTTTTVTITEPTALMVSGMVDANVSCNGESDGSATATVTGGTSSYTYVWSNSATTASISGVAAGTYTVTVTDANGCTATTSVTISEPAVLTASTVVNANVSCNGGTTGSATINLTGGTAPFEYTINNTTYVGVPDSSLTVLGLAEGTYPINVTDANGCTTTTSVTITEPTALMVSGMVDANVSCNGESNGSATVTATGGTSPYTYAWSNSATTASITGVAEGTYTVTVTDVNGCTATTSVTITEPGVLTASGVVNSNISCNGGANGSATVIVTGGTTPYSYEWDNSATTASIAGVAAGTYNVMVTDANGCTTTTSVTITEPTALVVSGMVDTNVSCNGGSNGSATVTATGGTSPYTYAWSNSATTASIEGVAEGTYTVTVTDAKGCTATTSVTITEPTVLMASTVVNSNVTCFGGSEGGATVNVTGGVAPYTYLWSNTATTASIGNVAAGTYTVTVTDVNGCTATASATITEPALVLPPTADAQVFCNSGEVSELVANGTDVLWYADETGGAPLTSDTALATGTYYATQTVGGCESPSRTAVSVTVNLTPEPVTPAQTFCMSATVADLMSSGTDVQWYADATGGDALSDDIALSTGTYYVSQTLNECESSRAAVSITVNVTPAPGAEAQTFCNSATVSELMADGTALKWYAVPTGGAPLMGNTTLSTGIYYVSQTLNNCEGPRTTVNVAVNVTPAPAAVAQAFCNNATVAELMAEGTGIKWYADATGGTALDSDVALINGTTYYASQTIDECESITRTAVAVTINITPAPIALDQTLCGGTTVADLMATGMGIKWYTDATGGTALAADTALAAGTYYASQTVDGCESDARTTVVVTLNITPEPVADAQTFCNEATVSDLMATGTDVMWYADETGGSPLA